MLEFATVKSNGLTFEGSSIFSSLPINMLLS